jgi:branched-chain amino acid transport system ATP-binding protein
MTALSLAGVTQRWGGVTALSDVTLDIAEGERVGIIGPNGAGKTTLLNAIIGDPPPTEGSVRLYGTDITRTPTHARARMGISRSFALVNVFTELTAGTNALLGADGPDHQYSMLRDAWKRRGARERVREILDEAGIADPEVPVRDLSYGQQRRLELALTLARDPRLLLLDEPSAGLHESERETLVDTVKQLPASVTVLVVDHDMTFLFGLVDRLVVLHHGVLIADGTPEAVRRDERVREVYLGGTEQHA